MMRTAARIFIAAAPLRRIATRAHAARVRGAITLVVLLVLVESVERAAADGRALARALAAAGDGATRGADRRAHDRADGAVLHDLHGLVPGARLARRVLVTGFDGARGRHRRGAGHARWRCRLRLLHR